MPKNRKYFPHKSVLFITSRTEEGLPLPPTHVLNTITRGILAEARTQYPVRICHHLFMANHLHLMLVIDNPEDVSAFMRYVKSEISHAVNRLLGRKKRTIWAEGYDSPILYSPEKVMHYIKYLYTNPARASLVDSISEYPGVSSWEMFFNDNLLTYHTRIPRPLLPPLATPALSINEQLRITRNWEGMDLPETAFVLEPWAWLECFSEELTIKACREEILEGIREAEARYRDERTREKRSVVGATALRRQSMLKAHTPESRGRRMIVICEDKSLRKQFIAHFRSLCETAARAYRSWKQGDLRLKIPPGMFSPSLPVLAAALPV